MKIRLSKRIRFRMIAIILPIIIIALSILVAISISSSNSIIKEQISTTMDQELSGQINIIDNDIEQVGKAAMNLSRFVGNTYKDLDLPTYEHTLASIASDNPLILGCGIWFKAFEYDPEQKYVGPYVYKSKDEYLTTYDYSNSSYNYFMQEYYLNALKSNDTYVFTDPYYDETTGITMVSCSMPMKNKSGTYVGCVTVDMELTSIQDIVSNIHVGDNGRALLTTADGTCISNSSTVFGKSIDNIQNYDNNSFNTATNIILNNDYGVATYQEGNETYNMYYSTIKELGWKLIITMPLSELNKSTNTLFYKLLALLIITIIIVCSVIFVVATFITYHIKHVAAFAQTLSDGDYTIDQLKVNTSDEIGEMSKSLNTMYTNNKNVLSNIATQSSRINDSNDSLKSLSSSLSAQFTAISNYMSHVNDAMMSSSAATEEVNASIEEANSSVSLMSQETVSTLKLSSEIKKRANEIFNKSQESYDNATKLYLTFEENLNKQIQNASVVSTIGTMANVISNIATQINLLSLNASIEAARAGEYGRGFAIVASEIGKLANETSEAVISIQDTTNEVQDSFVNLSDSSLSLLNFLKDTVAPDYNSFIRVSEQYETDSIIIEKASNNLAEMADSIEHIISEVSNAMNNIAESIQETSDNSGRTHDSISEASLDVENIAKLSIAQEDIVGDLNSLVRNFKF